MDEAEVAKQKYINVLEGSLDAPSQTFLVDCLPLDSSINVNSNIILRTVNDILRQLEIKQENILLFLTDAAWSLAGKTLKELYPSLMHVNALRTYYITVLCSVFTAACTIVNNWTSAGLLVSRAKGVINIEDLMLDLVKINQYRTLAANVEFLEGSACMITVAYGLLKNMQFDDDPCAI